VLGARKLSANLVPGTGATGTSHRVNPECVYSRWYLEPGTRHLGLCGHGPMYPAPPTVPDPTAQPDQPDRDQHA
jgi:hypothetical protein